jgi:hypothetical protein
VCIPLQAALEHLRAADGRRVEAEAEAAAAAAREAASHASLQEAHHHLHELGVLCAGTRLNPPQLRE